MGYSIISHSQSKFILHLSFAASFILQIKLNISLKLALHRLIKKLACLQLTSASPIEYGDYIPLINMIITPIIIKVNVEGAV